MTYVTIQNRVKRFLDRTDLDTDIKGWINDVRGDLATDFNWPHLWTESYLTTAAGSSNYALPTDYLDHKWVKLGSKVLWGYSEVDWEQQILNDADDEPDTHEPVAYYIKGEVMRLRPTPDATYTLTLYYYALPSDLSLDAATDFFTMKYPYVLIHGATILGSIFLDDQDKLVTHTGMFQKVFEKMLRKERAKRWKDVNLAMRTYKDYTTGMWKDRTVAHDS